MLKAVTGEGQEIPDIELKMAYNRTKLRRNLSIIFEEGIRRDLSIIFEDAQEKEIPCLTSWDSSVTMISDSYQKGIPYTDLLECQRHLAH